MASCDLPFSAKEWTHASFRVSPRNRFNSAAKSGSIFSSLFYGGSYPAPGIPILLGGRGTLSRAAEPCILPLTGGRGAAERPLPIFIVTLIVLGEIIYALRANKLRPDAAGRPGLPATAHRAERTIPHKNDG